MTREIHQRTSDGITVTLFAELTETVPADCEEIWLHVSNPGGNEDFEIHEIPPDKALEVFHHPYSVGNRLLTTGRI